MTTKYLTQEPLLLEDPAPVRAYPRWGLVLVKVYYVGVVAAILAAIAGVVIGVVK